jgi:hypothetical protein
MNKIEKELKTMQIGIHNTAKEKGWWDNPRNKGECIALMHSEVTEAYLARKAGNPPDDKIPEFSGLQAELADVVIRILDFGAGHNYDVVDFNAPLDIDFDDEDFFNEVNMHLSNAIEALRESDIDVSRYKTSLSLCSCVKLITTYFEDEDYIMGAMRAKTAFNKTRPKMHGGKKF